MRKRIDPGISTYSSAQQQDWLDLEHLAEIEVTSEDPAHPIEAALVPGSGSGWRAAAPGTQTIRIRFDEPQRVKLIHLEFTEDWQSRTQEFVLRWSANDEAQPGREIVRQQYNFSPVSSELEDYVVALNGVKILELEISPSISGGDIHASLAKLRLQ